MIFYLRRLSVVTVKSPGPEEQNVPGEHETRGSILGLWLDERIPVFWGFASEKYFILHLDDWGDE